ncbi:MAG: Crp/Fnr family transcriptional regulator [Acetivibrionales bacterium]|jgi:CRP-like cAMP-binding protein
MYGKWISILSKTELFSNITSKDLDTLFSCLMPKVHSFKRNECIAVAGEKFEAMGIVLSGSAAVTKENTAGNRIIITILKPGDMFGEMAAFSGSGLWPATVYAQENCTVVFLSPQKIVGFCEKACINHRLLIMNMLRIVTNKALMLNRKVEYLSIKSMRSKISTYLLEQYNKTGKATFVLPLKRHELADFLNVSRPSMSREMGRMREEGIIDFHMSSVRLNDIEALKNMAD